MELPTWNEILAYSLALLIQFALAIAALIVGRWLARLARRVMIRGLDRTELTPSMNTILVAVAYYGIWLLTIVAALLFAGLPSGVVLTCVGLLLLILVFSLQQSLHDLAAAVVFMLFKPFRLGDLIETKGTTGTVEDIGPFSTTLVTWDGKVVVLPNSQIQESGITNLTTKDSLVTDIDVRVRWGDDVDRARRIIGELIAEDPRALTDPSPKLPVTEEGDSWVVINVRAGVVLDDYYDLQDELRERIRVRMQEEGLALPNPRTDIHLTATSDPLGGAPNAA